MTEKAKSGPDAFLFNLKGMRAIASHHSMPVIAHDRINRAWDERFRRGRDGQPEIVKELAARKERSWLFRRPRRAV